MNGVRRAVPLDDVGNFAKDRPEVVIGDVRSQVHVADAARRNVDALIAANVVQDPIVVDQQIEIEVIESQCDGIRIVDAEREVEVHRRRDSEVDARFDPSQRIRRVDDAQIRKRVATAQQNQN